MREKFRMRAFSSGSFQFQSMQAPECTSNLRLLGQTARSGCVWP